MTLGQLQDYVLSLPLSKDSDVQIDASSIFIYGTDYDAVINEKYFIKTSLRQCQYKPKERL